MNKFLKLPLFLAVVGGVCTAVLATTYAITKEIKQVVYAPGAVVRMSVAVAVNKILTEVEKEEIKNLRDVLNNLNLED